MAQDGAPPFHGRFTLHVPLPYDDAAVFEFLRMRAIPGVELVDAGARVPTYARTMRFASGGGSFVATFEPEGLVCDYFVPSEADAAEVLIACLRVFDLKVDPSEIDSALASDPALAPLVQARPGIRVPGAADPHELAVRALLGQQISVASATTAAGRIASTYGEPVTATVAHPGLTHLFPTAERLSQVPVEELAMPRNRARAVIALTSALASGQVQLRGQVSSQEARDRLLSVFGIGPWTADYIRMRALADKDVLLSGDLIVRRAAAARGLPDDVHKLDERGARWNPWRSYATVRLWLSTH